MINSKELLKYTQGLNVLLVEDHEELRENVADILRNFFNTVTSASNGEEALDLYSEYLSTHDCSYDIVLSDIQMPIINGVVLTEKIYELNSQQLVVIISAYDDSEYLLPLINLGIEQFIKKPIDYQELLQVLLTASKKIVHSCTPVVDNPFVKVKLSEDFMFDKDNSALLNDGKNVYITKYEMLFLQELTTDLGKIYSNEEIVSSYLSKNESIDSQNIRKLVSKLRKKLPPNSLESIYGVGYRLVPYTNE